MRRFGIILAVTGWLALSARAISAGASFAGTPVSPGGTVRAEVPLSALEKFYVSEGGNPVPSYTVAVVGVPRGFDPRKSWPVLVILSTSDHKIQNRDDLEHYYAPTAIPEGWIVIAGDGPEPTPRRDSVGWRAGHTLAALDALHRSFPGSKNWPVACAGYSGGAKRAGLLAPLLASGGYRVAGIFFTGMNVDTLTEGYVRYRPGSSFLRTKIFISSGSEDKKASPQQHIEVIKSMQSKGFVNIRHRQFSGGHQVKKAHIQEALRWFRES